MQEKQEVSKLKKAGRLVLPLLDRDTAASITNSLERLESFESNLVILGQFKRGKSTLANCFLGKDILPHAAVPLTALITEVRYGKKEEVAVRYKNGKEEKLPISSISGFVTEKQNPKNCKNVETIRVFCDSPFLRRGLALIDTPGLGSTLTHNTETTEKYVRNCDAAVFVMSADSPLSLEESEFIKRVRVYAPKIIFVLNKIDYLSEEELADVRRHIEAELAEAGISAKLVPISARAGLEAITSKKRQALEKSGIPKLKAKLARFLGEGRKRVLLESVRLKILAASGALHNELSSELAALQLDSESLKGRIAGFREEARDILRSSEIQRAAIDDEFSGLLSEITEDLDSIKPVLSRKIYFAVYQAVEGSRAMPNNELVDLVDGLLKEDIEKELSAWWEAEDRKIRGKVKLVEEKYSGMNENAVSRLAQITKGIFDFQPRHVAAECSIDYETDFYFKVSGLYEGFFGPNPEMILPRQIFRKRLLGNLEKKVQEEVDKNCGRIRYDYLQRLEAGREKFKESHGIALEETKREIENGLESGLRLASSSVAEKTKRAERIKGLLGTLAKINKLVSP